MESPTVWTRLRSRAKGEVPTTDLLIYRDASLGAWECVEQTAERRARGETNPVEDLSAWIVFSLQTIGNALLDADDESDPLTQGFVPPLVHAGVLGLYQEVEPWLTRACEARANPDLKLRRKSPLPLPRIEPGVGATLSGGRGLLVALVAMRDELRARHTALPPDAEGRVAAALAAADYAEALAKSELAHHAPSERPVRLGPSLRRGVATLFEAGQIAAMPSLMPVDKPKKPRAPRQRIPPVLAPPRIVSMSALPPTAEDPWCLTHPDAAQTFKGDPRAREALAELWRSDPDPTETFRLAHEIGRALARGSIRFSSRHNHGATGYGHRAPWCPVFDAVEIVEIAGIHLRPRDRFVLDIGPADSSAGAAFGRRILVGDLRPKR